MKFIFKVVATRFESICLIAGVALVAIHQTLLGIILIASGIGLFIWQANSRNQR